MSSEPLRLENGALGSYARTIDPRTGLVRGLVSLPGLPGVPRVHYTIAVPAHDHPSGRRQYSEGAGASLDPATAALKAIGESLERYAAAFEPEGAVVCTQGDLGGPSVLLPTRYSAIQHQDTAFPYEPRTDSTTLTWELAFNPATRQQVWVPSAAVRLPHHRANGEPRLFPQTSNGLAASTDETQAKQNAMFELYERDSFMRHWRYGSVPLLSLGAESVRDLQSRCLLERIRREGFDCMLSYHARTNGVTTVFASVFRYNRIPFYALGAGTAFEVEIAVRKSLEEVCLNLYGLHNLTRQGVQPGAGSLVEQSVGFAVNSDWAQQAIEAMKGSDGHVQLDRDPQTANDSADDFMFLVNLTPRDLSNLGVHVFRAVNPRLLPLEHSSTFRHEGLDEFCPPVLRAGPHPFP